MIKKYLDKSLPIEDRINDLLSRMTIDEKINQMYTTGINEIDLLLEKIEKGEKLDISSTFCYFGFDPIKFNKLQEYQVNHTRLGIPILLASENTHGLSNPLASIFPTTGCLAATFDPSLARKFAKASAKEARALGIRQVYAPNIDISWDQRWGRIEENFGEDAYLTSKMGCQIVKGFQENKVAATLKHYIAYGLGEGGINLAPAHIGERDIRDYMMLPFETCIKKAKAYSLMPTYVEIDGIPVHASSRWMNVILRKELKFDGMVITDYGASNMLYGFHRIIDKPVNAGPILCDNRVDMEGCSYFGYNPEFRDMVKNKKYPISKVNECVKDILRIKFRLGLFEDPYAHINDVKNIHNNANKALAKTISDKGIVMLKNDGILPLDKAKSVAIIGPNADISQLGNYIYYSYFDPNDKTKAVCDMVKPLNKVFSENNIKINFARGSSFDKTNIKMLEEARIAVNNSDVVILCLGDNSNGGYCGGDQDGLKDTSVNQTVTSGEGYDLHNIELLPAQKLLFKEIKKLNKPIIMILYGGRPHAITEEEKDCSAILFAFGPGEQGSESLFDIIYGKINPSGRLPISFPRSTGHLPCYYNYKPSARGSFYQRPGSMDVAGKDYVFENPKALYPFGYGLSYTKFSYSIPTITKLSAHEFAVKLKVKNIGNYDGEEVVLAYVKALVQKTTPMVKRLAAFERINLKINEEIEVLLKITSEAFIYYDENMKKCYNNGRYKLIINNQEYDFEV